MDAKPMQFIAKHKVIFMIGGGVVVLYLVLKNMGGSAGGGTVQTAATSQVDPNAAQNAQIAAQLTAQANNQAAAFQQQQDKENFQLALLDKTGQIQTAQQENQIVGSLQLAGIQAKNASQQIDAQSRAQTEQVNAQTTLGMAETQAMVNIQKIMADQNVGIAAINGQTQQVQSHDAASVAIANASAMTSVAQAQAGVASEQAKDSMVVGIMGALFSDRRLKRDIEIIGKVQCLNLYSWRYVWCADDAPRSVGYMADEVKAVFPDCVLHHESGFDMVDYAKVARRFKALQ